MPKLFIANLTKHIQHFGYRVPEGQKIITQEIQPGSQVEIHGDYPVDTLSYIIEQHTAYGLTDAKNIYGKIGYVGLVYQFNKPVDLEAIQNGISKNDEELDKAALEGRKVAAAAANQSITDITGDQPKSLVIETIEDQKQGDDKTTMKETLEVKGHK